MKLVKISMVVIGLILVGVILTPSAWAFCGFYVAKADTKLYNQASQVVIARDGDRTILTMANDFQGEVEDFALVVPVPVILGEGQVQVGNPEILTRLDDFSAPRLVEYFDYDPCAYSDERVLEAVPAPSTAESNISGRSADSLGVTVERSFSAGEYDILILSAEDSGGLETWLVNNGYQIPSGAREVFEPYIKQNLKFFVAKVNLEEYQEGKFQSLRPLMIAFESHRFMLPIRLGMVNSRGEQDLIVYLLSPLGQIELTNYRTVKIPSDLEVPQFIQQEFGDFYQALFKHTHTQEGKSLALVEYAWDMANCDPCSAEPLNNEELKESGVFWLDSQSQVFITRLHLRYDAAHFPEDLVFHSTPNRELFQGRYIITHPYEGEISCDAGREYQKQVRARQTREAENLARVTGWDLNEIHNKMNITPDNSSWWEQFWE